MSLWLRCITKEFIMDNFAIEQDWTMYCDIPSRRWKIRRIRTARDKKLRHLEKETYKLWHEIRTLGYEPLDPPVRCGYKRLFMLTEDCKHTPNPDFYQGILDKINDIRYSPTKEFERKRTSKKWKRRKRRRKEQKLMEPNCHHFHKVLKFTEDEKRMFYEIKYYNKQLKREAIKYVFSEPWRFILRIRPHWITEKQCKDPLLEQHLNEIEKITDRYKNRGRLIKMRGSNSYSWKRTHNQKEDRKRYAYNSLQNRPLYLIMEEYNEEKNDEHTNKRFK